MATGEKLGKIFGAVGSGLSFIPGPWSALGLAFSAAGTAATAVDQGKQRREAEREEQQAANPPLESTPIEADNQRPQAGQSAQNQPVMAGPQSSKVFQQPQSRYNLGQMGENMDNSVMQMLIKESGGWYDG